ncbi:DNA-directed RNA polymerase subunit omega [mine drainage metagenome]|uniref:DNA-directed RNA polymerase n=1 Tax=mine drainage metagenome TaxID=410659 RepID=A0A1J5T249_9ZZZZ
MRDDHLQSAPRVIDDPYILVNVVSSRVKQHRRGNRPLVVSLVKLSLEDAALREIAEGRITYEAATPEDIAKSRGERAPQPLRNVCYKVA